MGNCVGSYHSTICLCHTPTSCQSTGPSWIFAYPTKTHRHFWIPNSLRISQESQETRLFGLDNFSPKCHCWATRPRLLLGFHRAKKRKSPLISVFFNISKALFLLSVLLPAKEWSQQGPTSYLYLPSLCCKSQLSQKR